MVDGWKKPRFEKLHKVKSLLEQITTLAIDDTMKKLEDIRVAVNATAKGREQHERIKEEMEKCLGLKQI